MLRHIFLTAQSHLVAEIVVMRASEESVLILIISLLVSEGL